MKSMTVILLAVAFVVIVCAGFTAAYALSGGNGTMQSFNQTDNGKTITVKPGETIKIQLDENPTTGYSWAFNATPGLTIAQDVYHEPDSDLVGAGGVHEWQIKATGTGNQQVSAVYRRSWEPVTGSEDTFVLNIKIE
ncbi:MAG: Chagasin family peptidase inhibitor I42 [Methanocella sp. PtaU1.Bin125]|nr:MAG: Chagasin family peptidase inhibitor I42 [Methanocella sp. PtaU1.Bin125]